jgi:AcrR family transcriptional regulator
VTDKAPTTGGGSNRPPSPMTRRIMQAADRLFYQKGIRAVGVDTIAAAAGISKRSLYDTFPSKDALVAAYLNDRIRPLPVSDEPPATQVLALFDQLHSRFAAGDFRGCAFVNAVTELADDCEAARAIAVRYKDDWRHHVRGLLAQAGAADSDILTGQLALLTEGAIASMLVREDASVALQARDAAATLMRAAGIAMSPLIPPATDQTPKGEQTAGPSGGL